MVLILVGLGLCDELDVTMRGLEEIKKADVVYLESYTALLSVSRERLESFFGKKIIEADRLLVEQNGNDLVLQALSSTVALLVIGDPFCATTHAELYLYARKRGVVVKVVHNASIVNAVGACGLQVYRFGETVSIPFFEEKWRPDSFYHKIKRNMDAGLHTLCLLDIKVKEQTEENMMRGRPIFEAPRYMTVAQAISQLYELEAKLQKDVCQLETKAFGVARVGSGSQIIYSVDISISLPHADCTGTMNELSSANFGPPPHSLVICAPQLHDLELEFFEFFGCETTRNTSCG